MVTCNALLPTNEPQWTIVEIELLATWELEVGLPADQLPMLRKTIPVPAERRFLQDKACLKASIAAIPFGYSKLWHSLPEAWVQCGSIAPPLHYGCIKLWPITGHWLSSQLSRLSFEPLWVGSVLLPAFQLPMFAKCDALQKGDLLNHVYV